MKEVKNKPVSIRQKLYNIAKREGRSLDQIVLLYMQERLIYRLSITKYVEHFILKGGLFLYNVVGIKERPTKDMDFLAKRICNQDEQIHEAFVRIASKPCDDGLVFEPGAVKVETIAKDTEYKGKRITIPCSLDVMRKNLIIDLGFGDVIIPRPQEMSYPVLINENPEPNLYCYSMESVIAEKFHAMVKLAYLNSRLKDFYDIYNLVRAYDFEGRVVQEAIEETFSKRKTPIKGELKVFEDAFQTDQDKLAQWNAFLRRIGRADELGLQEVLIWLEQFLVPIWHKSCKKDEFLEYWLYEHGQWVKSNY